jgi:hypothetical protein
MEIPARFVARTVTRAGTLRSVFLWGKTYTKSWSGINVLPELASGSIMITVAETTDEIIEEMKRLTRKGWELPEEHQKTYPRRVRAIEKEIARPPKRRWGRIPSWQFLRPVTVAGLHSATSQACELRKILALQWHTMALGIVRYRTYNVVVAVYVRSNWTIHCLDPNFRMRADPKLGSLNQHTGNARRAHASTLFDLQQTCSARKQQNWWRWASGPWRVLLAENSSKGIIRKEAT